MLPKVNRLKHRQDFSVVYRQGLRRSQICLTLRAYQRLSPGPQSPDSDLDQVFPSLPPTRFGISISQKVSKRAVIRNRIKRQIRAALRHLLPRLSPGWDVVIVVQPSAKGCNYGEFLQQLEQLLAQAEVLNGHS